MKSWMDAVTKEILLEKQEAHIIQYHINKVITIQSRLDEAFKNDQSHTRSLSQ